MPGLFNKSTADGPQGASQGEVPIRRLASVHQGVPVGPVMRISTLSPTLPLRQRLMLPMKPHNPVKPDGVCLLLEVGQESF